MGPYRDLEPPEPLGASKHRIMPIPRDSLSRANAGYVEAMYQRYLADPASVPGDWSLFFAGFEFASGSAASRSIAETAAGG